MGDLNMAYSYANGYSDKYPMISIDPQVNYPNASNNLKKPTVEEWQDLLHHTHKITEILDSNGQFLGNENINIGTGVSKEEYDALVDRIKAIEDNNSGSSNIDISTLATKDDIEDVNQKITDIESGIENGNYITKAQFDDLVSRIEVLEQNSTADLSNYVTKDQYDELANSVNDIITKLSNLESSTTTHAKEAIFVGDWDATKNGNQTYDESGTY